MQQSQLPIGLFDSGVGGLTVLNEVYRQLPQESVLYFGDTARLPYGDRTPSEIVQFVEEIMQWMVAEGVKMVIMACNTSSALALETVRAQFSLPVLGLILPGAQAAVGQGRRIGVIATQATVASGAYPKAIAEIDPATQVWQVACPKFVPLIEQNQIFSLQTRQIAREYLSPLLDCQIDTLIYGCTHYRHLEPVLRQILPATVQIIDPAQSVVAAAAKELHLLGLKHNGQSSTRFGVSGCPQTFAKLSQQWLAEWPTVEQVELPRRVRARLQLDF